MSSEQDIEIWATKLCNEEMSWSWTPKTTRYILWNRKQEFLEVMREVFTDEMNWEVFTTRFIQELSQRFMPTKEHAEVINAWIKCMEATDKIETLCPNMCTYPEFPKQ